MVKNYDTIFLSIGLVTLCLFTCNGVYNHPFLLAGKKPSTEYEQFDSLMDVSERRMDSCAVAFTSKLPKSTRRTPELRPAVEPGTGKDTIKTTGHPFGGYRNR